MILHSVSNWLCMVGRKKFILAEKATKDCEGQRGITFPDPTARKEQLSQGMPSIVSFWPSVSNAAPEGFVVAGHLLTVLLTLWSKRGESSLGDYPLVPDMLDYRPGTSSPRHRWHAKFKNVQGPAQPRLYVTHGIMLRVSASTGTNDQHDESADDVTYQGYRA